MQLHRKLGRARHPLAGDDVFDRKRLAFGADPELPVDIGRALGEMVRLDTADPGLPVIGTALDAVQQPLIGVGIEEVDTA